MVAGRHETAHRRNIPPMGIAITMGRVSPSAHIHTYAYYTRALILRRIYRHTTSSFSVSLPRFFFLLILFFSSRYFILSSSSPSILFHSTCCTLLPSHLLHPSSWTSRPRDTIPISDVICIIPVSPPRRSAAQLLAGI